MDEGDEGDEERRRSSDPSVAGNVRGLLLESWRRRTKGARFVGNRSSRPSRTRTVVQRKLQKSVCVGARTRVPLYSTRFAVDGLFPRTNNGRTVTVTSTRTMTTTGAGKKDSSRQEPQPGLAAMGRRNEAERSTPGDDVQSSKEGMLGEKWTGAKERSVLDSQRSETEQRGLAQ